MALDRTAAGQRRVLRLEGYVHHAHFLDDGSQTISVFLCLLLRAGPLPALRTGQHFGHIQFLVRRRRTSCVERTGVGVLGLFHSVFGWRESGVAGRSRRSFGIIAMSGLPQIAAPRMRSGPTGTSGVRFAARAVCLAPRTRRGMSAPRACGRSGAEPGRSSESAGSLAVW